MCESKEGTHNNNNSLNTELLDESHGKKIDTLITKQRERNHTNIIINILCVRFSFSHIITHFYVLLNSEMRCASTIQYEKIWIDFATNAACNAYFIHIRHIYPIWIC